MPNVIEFGAAAGASAVAVFLGLAFWPHIENSSAPGKPAVSQPVFVASSTTTKPQVSGTSVAPAATTPAAVAPTAPAAATDDASAMAKLALALQAKPPAASAAPAATRSLSLAGTVPGAPRVSEAARRLCAQGLVALAAGDIAGARLYLERAAENGDARALLVLGETYDPATLARMGALGVKGEAAKARDYYAKALAAGMGAARERIAALEAQ
ncbi:MAG: hypothetical protein ABSE69_13125 [Roseiarcus sp.]|jgi:tetratricopeptide (TPR) repeat protein